MAIHFVFTQLDISFPVDNNRSHHCWPCSSLCPTYVLNYLFAPCGCLSIYRFVHCGFCFTGYCVVFHLTSICVRCPLPPGSSCCRLFSVFRRCRWRHSLSHRALAQFHQLWAATKDYLRNGRVSGLPGKVWGGVVIANDEVLVCIIVLLPVESLFTSTSLFHFISP